MLDYTTLKELVEIDSPTGFTHHANDYIVKVLKSYNVQTKRTNKNVVKCKFSEQPTLGIAAHVDTLGGIISEITSKGKIRISKIGGLSLTGFEGGYCKIYTLEDTIYTGTFLLDNPATHVNRNVDKTQRTLSNMHIRLDENVRTKAEVKQLGIQVGDFVCFDTNYQELPSGFIKSRFMDNKAGCFVLFELAKRLQALDKPVPVELFFSNYEEVGHGGTCGYSDSIQELLVIDMGVVGEHKNGLETACSICVKDGSGPYDYAMKKKLIQLAKQTNIPFELDVYDYYSSDGSAAMRAGNDYRVALIGPGVSASHGVERTHKQGIEATIDLCMAYIEDSF